MSSGPQDGCWGVSGIYAIKHVHTGRLYIGSSADVGKRWSRHRSMLRRGVHFSRPLQAAWLKYGEDAFEFVLLETVPVREDLVQHEQAWMDQECPVFNQRRQATNQTGVQHTPEARARMGEAARRMWADPEKRARLVEYRRREDVRLANAEAQRRARTNPELRAADVSHLAEAWARPEVRARFGEAQRARFAVPGAREELAKAQRAAWADEELRRRHSEKMREVQKRLTESGERKPVSDETRAKLSASIKAGWARRRLTGSGERKPRSDEHRAKLSAALKAAWARKRDLKEKG